MRLSVVRVRALERARDCVRRERAHTQMLALHAITRHPFRSDSLSLVVVVRYAPPRRRDCEGERTWLQTGATARGAACTHTCVICEGIPDTGCPRPRESRRAPASTHVSGCNNPRNEAARLKKRNILKYCAAPQQLCETCRCGKRAQISELEHITKVQGPQSQRKSSSADAPVCKDRERKQCNLSSYCAAPQPLCSASCGGKCARKWHFHGNSHTCQHALRQRA
jgi:hypothetical protein